MMLNIRALGLPGAAFDGAAALAQHRDNAATYEAAVRNYAAGGDDCQLWEALAALGFVRAEIMWHVKRPGRRMRQGFA